MPFSQIQWGGFVGREGRLTEAYEPIPVRLLAHLHLGKDRARGMGYRGLYYNWGSKCTYLPGDRTFDDQHIYNPVVGHIELIRDPFLERGQLF